MAIKFHFDCITTSMSKCGVTTWSQREHGRLTDNLQITDQGVHVWEEQVLGKEFRNVSWCLAW